MTVVAATFGALYEVQLMHAIYHFKAQEVNNPMLQTVCNSELKRGSCGHYKPITPSWRKHFAKCCKITLLLRSDFAAFLYSRVYFLLKFPIYAASWELRTSRWKPTSQSCEVSLVLRNNFAALLGVCETLQTPFFSCEMIPEASRYLLPTLGDILHQIFVV